MRFVGCPVVQLPMPVRMAGSLAAMEGHCGAIAFSRTGDPALGDFDDAVILKTVGEVDIGLLSV
jgi:hypothetical protein